MRDIDYNVEFVGGKLMAMPKYYKGYNCTKRLWTPLMYKIGHSVNEVLTKITKK